VKNSKFQKANSSCWLTNEITKPKFPIA